MAEVARYIRPAGLQGVEALHASFVTHRYRPHSHPTWTVATVHRGAAQFALDDTQQRAVSRRAVRAGARVRAHRRAGRPRRLGLPGALPGPGGDRVVGGGGRRRRARRAGSCSATERLRRSLAAAHAALASQPPGLGVDEAVLAAVDALRPHLAPGPPARRQRGWSTPRCGAPGGISRSAGPEPVRLEELAAVAGLSRFELARAFRAQVGLPPHAFQLPHLRVRRARALLAAGEPPVAVAAATAASPTSRTCTACSSARSASRRGATPQERPRRRRGRPSSSRPWRSPTSTRRSPSPCATTSRPGSG